MAKFLDDVGLAHFWENVKAYVNSHGGGGGGVPSGCILIWSGALDSIPSGWALCDGNSGTPDLRGRFVLGSSGSYAHGSTGGEETHKLTTSEMPKHSHIQNATINPSENTSTVGYQCRRVAGSQTASEPYTYVTGTKVATTKYAREYVNTESSGSSYAHNNMPPYYVLCYIMKL